MATCDSFYISVCYPFKGTSQSKQVLGTFLRKKRKDQFVSRESGVVAMAVIEEPIISRLDRLDNMLRHLEDIRGSNRSPKSSWASIASSGTPSSDGQRSSVDFSPKSLEKHSRPLNRVIMETEVKGTLIERLEHVEDRVLKLELELEVARKTEEKTEKRTPKKGLKQLVKQCVKGKGKHSKPKRDQDVI